MRRREAGYALLLVAVTVAIAAVALLASANVLSGTTRDLRLLRELSAQRIEAESLITRATFLLLTEPINGRAIAVGGDRQVGIPASELPSSRLMNRGGVEEVRLDGRDYLLGRDSRISIQDEAGLLDLNTPDDRALAGLLEQVGVESRDARRLAATLNDYVDEDGLSRAGGAELADYRRAGVAGPANGPLRVPWEAANALGWKQGLTDFERAALWDLAGTPVGAEGINVNTAPYEVLLAATGDRRLAQDLLMRREFALLASAEGALLAFPESASGARLGTSTGSSFRVRIAHYGAKRESWAAFEAQVAFADDGSDVPIYWRTLRRVRVAKSGVRGNAIERFPAGPTLRTP